MSNSDLTPAVVGLVLLFIGPPLVAARGARLKGDAASLPAMLAGQVLLTGLMLGIFAIVLIWEGRCIGSLGLGRPSVASLVWGLALAALFIFALGLLLLRLPGWLRLGGFDETLAELQSLPVWYLVLAVVAGGTAEEVLLSSRPVACDRKFLLRG